MEKFIVATVRELCLLLPLREWQEFYRIEFDLEVNFSDLIIPPRQDGFGRLLVIASGIICEQVFQKCCFQFNAWKYTDSNLDQVVLINDRINKKTYAVWVRGRVEANQELKNRSANQLSREKI